MERFQNDDGHLRWIAAGNRWLTTQELADEVNEGGRYRKRDGSAVTAFHHGRTRNSGRLFEPDGSRVRLREPGP